MQWLSLSKIKYMTHHNILYLMIYGSFISLYTLTLVVSVRSLACILRGATLFNLT